MKSISNSSGLNNSNQSSSSHIISNAELKARACISDMTKAQLSELFFRLPKFNYREMLKFASNPQVVVKLSASA